MNSRNRNQRPGCGNGNGRGAGNGQKNGLCRMAGGMMRRQQGANCVRQAGGTSFGRAKGTLSRQGE